MPQTKTKLKNAITPADHVKGPEDAVIEMVEYGDYQCPACGEAHDAMRQLERVLKNDLRFVFRNFPLSKLHEHATAAAQAVEAAALQNKFWEMHDLVYDNQHELDMDSLKSYAKKLKLDLGKFEEDLRSQKVQKKVEADFYSGVMSGVNGTPTFFINGVHYQGPTTFEDMREYLMKMEH